MALAATKRSNFLVQAKTSIQAIAEMKVVTLRPYPEAMEHLEAVPAAFIGLRADTDANLHIYHTDLEKKSAALIRVYGDVETDIDELSIELEKLAGAVEAKLLADAVPEFGAMTPPVCILDIRIIEDPEVEIEHDRSSITIGVEFQ